MFVMNRNRLPYIERNGFSGCHLKNSVICVLNRNQWFEFLAQAFSFKLSLTQAYEPGVARLMLGGKDRSC